MIFSITTKTQIDISEEDQKEIAFSYLRNKFNFDKGYFVDLDTGKLCRTVHYHSHNSWSEIIEDRDASNEEICLQIILNKLK